MNEELKRWYEAQFDMFNEKGWKDLIEQVAQRQKNFDNIRGIPTAEMLKYRQGQLCEIDWLLNWQAIVESNFKELQNEDAV